MDHHEGLSVAMESGDVFSRANEKRAPDTEDDGNTVTANCHVLPFFICNVVKCLYLCFLNIL